MITVLQLKLFLKSSNLALPCSLEMVKDSVYSADQLFVYHAIKNYFLYLKNHNNIAGIELHVFGLKIVYFFYETKVLLNTLNI